MKSKAWVIMPEVYHGDNGIEVENEMMPLVLCCDCEHFDGKNYCEKLGLIVKNNGKWFCAEGKEQ